MKMTGWWFQMMFCKKRTLKPYFIAPNDSISFRKDWVATRKPIRDQLRVRGGNPVQTSLREVFGWRKMVSHPVSHGLDREWN